MFSLTFFISLQVQWEVILTSLLLYKPALLDFYSATAVAKELALAADFLCMSAAYGILKHNASKGLVHINVS